MNPNNMFGIIQPKPIYRDQHGRYRKESHKEFRDRHDDAAWSFGEAQRILFTQAAKFMMTSDPWAAVLETPAK